MYLFTIFSSLICIQFISIVASDTSDASQHSRPDTLPQVTAVSDNEDVLNYDNEQDDENVLMTRASEFLRFGRQTPTASASFLRFGRSQPAFLRFGRPDPNSAAFLRFGRQAERAASDNFLRFGREPQHSASNNFLRFGRDAEHKASSNFLRFGRKGEFLRFG